MAFLLILCTACAALTGCGLPDRHQEVDNLEIRLSSMPGVTGIEANYSNDFTAGYYLKLTVKVPTAPEGQIVEVAKQINELKKDDFDGYRQTTEFVVGHGTMATFDAVLNPDQVADRTRRLRQIGSAAPTAAITWTGDTLELLNAPAAADSFAAVRIGLATEPAHVTVTLKETGPRWAVDFPFDPQQETRIQRQLSALPADVASVTVTNGAMSILFVRVRDPKMAYQDITAVISSVQATPEHPLMLEWTWAGTEPAARKFAGSVHVAGCQYPHSSGEKSPQSYYTPEAIDLRRRMRDEFDACR